MPGGRQDRCAAIVRTVQNSFVSERGPRCWKSGSLEGESEAERGVLPVPEFVQKQDLVPFTPDEQRLRRTARRGPGLEEGIEKARRIDLQQKRTDGFRGGCTQKRHHQSHVSRASGLIPVQVCQQGSPGAHHLRGQFAFQFTATVNRRQPGPPPAVPVPQARCGVMIRLHQLRHPRLDFAEVSPAVQALEQHRNSEWIGLESFGIGEAF